MVCLVKLRMTEVAFSQESAACLIFVVRQLKLNLLAVIFSTAGSTYLEHFLTAINLNRTETYWKSFQISDGFIFSKCQEKGGVKLHLGIMKKLFQGIWGTSPPIGPLLLGSKHQNHRIIGLEGTLEVFIKSRTINMWEETDNCVLVKMEVSSQNC